MAISELQQHGSRTDFGEMEPVEKALRRANRKTRVRNEAIVAHPDVSTAIRSALKDLGISKKVVENILDAYPRGVGLANATRMGLMSLGATDKQARSIMAAFGLAQVCGDACMSRVGDRAITSPRDVVAVIRGAVGERDQEHFLVLLLDARQQVIDVLGVAKGSLSSVEVHPRDVFREAVRRNAHSIVLAHNHPSGHPSPSEADKTLTNRMVSAGKTFGIPVLDHIIVSPRADFSFANAGILE